MQETLMANLIFRNRLMYSDSNPYIPETFKTSNDLKRRIKSIDGSSVRENKKQHNGEVYHRFQWLNIILSIYLKYNDKNFNIFICLDRSLTDKSAPVLAIENGSSTTTLGNDDPLTENRIINTTDSNVSLYQMQ